MCIATPSIPTYLPTRRTSSAHSHACSLAHAHIAYACVCARFCARMHDRLCVIDIEFRTNDTNKMHCYDRTAFDCHRSLLVHSSRNLTYFGELPCKRLRLIWNAFRVEITPCGSYNCPSRTIKRDKINSLLFREIG
jgi:hypothetical protein